MTLSLFLVIVTCFAMSFALRSAAIARLILDASLLHCTQERPTLLNFAVPSFCWMRFPLYLLLCGRLCCGFVPRCRRALPRSGGAFLLSFSLSLFQARLLSARDLQHLTWLLRGCLLEVGQFSARP